jgi:hypothetical protein
MNKLTIPKYIKKLIKEESQIYQSEERIKISAIMDVISNPKGKNILLDIKAKPKYTIYIPQGILNSYNKLSINL